MEHDKPLIAFTLGDPAGVGPETIASAWRDPRLHAICRAVVIGHPGILRRAVRLVQLPARVVEVSAPEELHAEPEILPCLACGGASVLRVPAGKVDRRGGQAAFDALALAADLAMHGRVDAITTAPLNKAALHAAGHRYPGHTELLADLCGTQDAAMMLYLAPGGLIRGAAGLGVVHVTLHLALREVFANLTTERIVARTHLADAAMRALESESQAADQGPIRIGVCALNPHAGEDGLFGDDERRIIQPAVQRACAEGLSVQGPLPADSLLARAVAGEFEAVVAMYHDQGHIALKLLDMYRAVNITLGLPIIRTSVAHGTAFDLAWQGKAKAMGLIEAARVAAQLARSSLPVR